jgi:WS/DGAT/MGAT family acyltransferase
MADTFYEPLTARDAWFLYAEGSDTPFDIGTVYVFEAGSQVPGGGGALAIEESIAQRLHLVPRYRQKLNRVAFNLGHPVWVDGPNFDLGFHVRHEVLPEPADAARARAAVARILQRRLDKSRPLWEMAVLRGLPGGRVMIVNRTHHAMVDGVSNRDIMSILFDATPGEPQPQPPAAPWRPRPSPGNLRLIWAQLVGRILGTGGPVANPLVGLAMWWMSWRGFLQLGRSARAHASSSTAASGPSAAVVASRCRWPASRPSSGDSAVRSTTPSSPSWARVSTAGCASAASGCPEMVRVFIPVSVRQPGGREQMGNRISGMVIELPTGDLAFEERLRRVHASTEGLKRSRQALAADRIAGLAGWAPPSLLVLADTIATPSAIEG